MQYISKALILFISILILQLSTTYSKVDLDQNNTRKSKHGSRIKSATFLSEKIEVVPGLCAKKDLVDIKFPKGHLAIKSFDAELVDEKGNSVPLYEAYVRHWYTLPYYENITISRNPSLRRNFIDGRNFTRNGGACSGPTLPQYWGLGAETRGVTSNIPDPFAIEVGDPQQTPYGYEQKWLLNIMIIDTRGVEDREGCEECRCNLYNATTGFYGQPLKQGYEGGFNCCYDNTQCKLREGFQGPKRSLYLKYSLREYTIKWVDWDPHHVPVKIYVLDVTDRVSRSDRTQNCEVEYTIPPNVHSDERPHVEKAYIPMEKGGYLIYAVAHQHVGGIGATLYGQDGRILCTSTPKYGAGNEPGNEKGYVVGMSVCYPKPGSVKINNGETLAFESKYTNKYRTGVMGQMTILVAEQLPSANHKHEFDF